MAGFACIAATGLSLERLLNAAFAEDDPIPDAPTRPRAVLVRTEDLEAVGGSTSLIQPPTLSIYLYRVDFNKTTRAGWSGVASQDGVPRLPLDLHFLITPWAANAEFELRMLGRAMQCLEQHPSLGGALLAGDADWGPGDSVQVVMEEVSTEAVMRTFDSLPHDYKLSVPYVVRVVRLDGRPAAPPRDAVAAVAGIRLP